MYHLGAGIAQVFGILMMTLAVLKSSKTLHNKTFRNILRAPMKFFDTTPQGRILNRLGKDVDVLDTNMQFSLRNAISGKEITVNKLHVPNSGHPSLGVPPWASLPGRPSLGVPPWASLPGCQLIPIWPFEFE